MAWYQYLLPMLESLHQSNSWQNKSWMDGWDEVESFDRSRFSRHSDTHHHAYQALQKLLTWILVPKSYPLTSHKNLLQVDCLCDWGHLCNLALKREILYDFAKPRASCFFPNQCLHISSLYFQHILESLWSRCNLTNSKNSVLSFLFVVKYAWAILSTKEIYFFTLFSLKFGAITINWKEWTRGNSGLEN